MARVNDIIRGLQIIQRYCKVDVQLGGAEHDIIYAPPLDRPLTNDHEQELKDYGWYLDDDVDVWARSC